MNNTPRYQPSKREWIGNAIKLKLNGRKSLKMYPFGLSNHGPTTSSRSMIECVN